MQLLLDEDIHTSVVDEKMTLDKVINDGILTAFKRKRERKGDGQNPRSGVDGRLP
jgi:hypothetical protein